LLNIPQKIGNIFHLKFPHNKLHQIPQRTMQIFADLYTLQKKSQFLAVIFAIAKISEKVSKKFGAYICGNIYFAKNVAKFCGKNM
jgi:hypothetical protein